MSSPSRREVFKALAAGVVAVSLPWKARALAAIIVPPGPGTAFWVAPLRARSYLGRGWTLDTLEARRDGLVELTLRHVDGREASVAMHRRHGAPRGIAHTRHLDLILMNGADGNQRSDEELGLTLMSLARRIERNERAGLVRIEDVSELVSHERWLSARV